MTLNFYIPYNMAIAFGLVLGALLVKTLVEFIRG